MANEYSQYFLNQQIAGGGVNVSGQLLDAYRKGTDVAAKEASDAQRSKLQEIAIKQGQQKIQDNQVIAQTNQLKLEQLKKSIPLLDAQTTLSLQKTTEELGTDAIKAQTAALHAVDDLQDTPLNEAIDHLGKFNQIITAHTASNDSWQQFVSSPQATQIVSEYPELKGNLNDPAVQNTIKAVQSGVMAAAPILKSLAEKKIVADAALGRATLSAQTRLEVANINKDTRLSVAELSKTAKSAKVGKNDIDAGTRLVYGRASEDFPGASTAEIAGMGSQVALIGNTIMGKGYDQASAYEAAYARVKGAYDASGGDTGAMNKILSALGFGGKGNTAPSITQSLTVGAGDNKRTLTDKTGETTAFSVNGKIYNIPNDKIDAFKKDMGIQ